MRTLALITLLFVSTATACPVEALGDDQLQWLHFARHTAPTFNAAADFGELGAGVLYQESSFCRKLVDDAHSSFGCGQVTLDTAADVAKTPVSEFMLTHENELNINLSLSRLSWCLTREHHDRALALVCYNSGPSIADGLTHKEASSNAYVVAVTCRMRRIALIN